MAPASGAGWRVSASRAGVADECVERVEDGALIGGRQGDERLPAREHGLIGRRIPEYTESGAPGGYYNAPALDGSRPGVYYINMRDMNELAKLSLPSLTYHEGIPGHHWQFALQQEAEGIPFIRSAMMFFAAYSEGWALYTEQLMDEIGVYADNPINRLGRSDGHAGQAVR